MFFYNFTLLLYASAGLFLDARRFYQFFDNYFESKEFQIAGMKKFKKIYLEITNVCNLHCTFCPPTIRKPGFMTVESFGKTLEQIQPYTSHLNFHVKGEPLLHPELGQILDVSHTKGFKVNITTNGTLIRKVAPTLLTSPALRTIYFSLHSLEGNPGLNHSTEYLRDILSFVKEALAQTSIFISLRLWNLTQDNMENLAKQKNRDILAAIEAEFSLKTPIPEQFIPGKGVKITPNLFINYEPEFKWPDIGDTYENSIGFCHALRTHLAILVDGTVVPCCLDGEGRIKLGNIFTESFSEIIDGTRANRIYNGFSGRNAVEELCRKCCYKEKFQ